MASDKLDLETTPTYVKKIAAVKSIRFKLYDTAAHRSIQAYIDDSGQIWYNNSRRRDMPIWEPLNESGEGCYIKDVTIEIYDPTNNQDRSAKDPG